MAKKKVTKVVTAPAAEIEVVSKPGMGIDEGIVITTFLLMIAAIALVAIANGHYAVGP